MNKYYGMIGHMHMPEEQYEQLKAELSERTKQKRNTRPVWQRYAVAAALALCLMGTAATVYAAVHYQWFDLFFANGNQEAAIIEEMIGKASAEKVIAQDDNYKFTVLSHLYSKEQQMGLVVCSFQFLKEQHTHLNVLDRDKNESVILKKNGIMNEQIFSKDNKDKSERMLSFRVGDESETALISASMTYFADEMAEDGGYLIGIRYSFDIKNAVEQMPDLTLSLENAGDVEGNLKVRLPVSEDVECVHFASENNPENVIVVSPMGMTLTITGDKSEYPENPFGHEILDSLKLVMENETKTIEDMGTGYETNVLEEETESTYTWYLQKGFTNLVNVPEIDYIELGGNKYNK